MDETTTKKACARRGRDGTERHRNQFWTTDATRRDLAELHAAYVELTGREVSNSLIIRRAVESLKIKVRDMEPAHADAEVAAILRQAR
jgi:hypothetical protein